LPDESQDQQNIAAALVDVSERVTLLVREEIELAKAEVASKLKKLIRGLVVGAAAGVFLLLALLFALHGFAWLLWYELPTGRTPNFFWGFFALAAILVILAVVAGLLAFKLVRAASPPVPSMALDEARKIRETVGAGAEVKADAPTHA
jgi:hypothetical protein